MTSDEFPVSLGLIYDPEIRYQVKETVSERGGLENWQFGLIFIVLMLLLVTCGCIAQISESRGKKSSLKYQDNDGSE